MAENNYQAYLIKKLESMFIGCQILKNDANYIQGIPDLTILYGPMWATLEVKDYKNANKQPNQEYYVNLHNIMSFSKFIFPENEEEVLNKLRIHFKT